MCLGIKELPSYDDPADLVGDNVHTIERRMGT
jgi:hypothetical protein